ncbi:NAD-dependent deacylase [Tropicimonas sp. IMCC34043]|uniref:NAD-dependent deacylase n=1 Tax=Tropicimonas sp. IMCC34043 TaxID=2248760 RepID=UPI000E27C733|nr:NAD-dependent deacylase [Tropicimonas sp. IMCC34043]
MRKIVLLTGAGISAESGLGTFRDVGGIWSQYDLEDVATPRGFVRNPTLVHDFYNARRANAMAASPNAAHAALARLEAEWPGDVVLITQNIDDLHERAGQRTVIHMHGELMQGLCVLCGARWPVAGEMSAAGRCPACDCVATRPDVVWFGEMPYHMEEIDRHLRDAELFAAIGTSGQVYPAAGFVMLAAAAGARTININLEGADGNDAFEESLIGPATRIVPAWVDHLLATV